MGDTGFPRRTYSFVPRSKYLAVVAVAALFLSVVELTDVFQLPFESSFGGAVASGGLFSMGLLTSLLNIGYAGLFILMAMESASLPIPSEVVLPFAGYLVFLGKMNFGLAFVDAHGRRPGRRARRLLPGPLAGEAGRLPAAGKGGRLSESPGRRRAMGRLQGCLERLHREVHPGPQVGDIDPGGPAQDEDEDVRDPDGGGLLHLVGRPDLRGLLGGPLWQSSLDSLSAFAGQAALVVIAVLSVLYVVYYLGPFGRRGIGDADDLQQQEHPSSRSPTSGHFIKFGIVGAIGIVVNEGLLILFQSMGVYLLYAGAVAIEISILSNFILNDLWTFRDRRSGSAAVRLVKFNVLMLAGLVRQPGRPRRRGSTTSG